MDLIQAKSYFNDINIIIEAGYICFDKRIQQFKSSDCFFEFPKYN